MTFLTSESGAVTVDWVVLTAGLVGLGLATMTVVSSGVGDASVDIAQNVGDTRITTSFYSLPSYVEARMAYAALNYDETMTAEEAAQHAENLRQNTRNNLHDSSAEYYAGEYHLENMWSFEQHGRFLDGWQGTESDLDYLLVDLFPHMASEDSMFSPGETPDPGQWAMDIMVNDYGMEAGSREAAVFGTLYDYGLIDVCSAPPCDAVAQLKTAAELSATTGQIRREEAIAWLAEQ